MKDTGLTEKELKKINTINEKFIELGFDLKEDLIELFENHEDIASEVFNTKFRKIVFTKDEESNSYIMTLDNLQISFDVLCGEDEEGSWYEASCHILKF